MQDRTAQTPSRRPSTATIAQIAAAAMAAAAARQDQSNPLLATSLSILLHQQQILLHTPTTGDPPFGTLAHLAHRHPLYRQ